MNLSLLVWVTLTLRQMIYDIHVSPLPIEQLLQATHRCVIKGFGGVFVLSRCFFGFSVGEGAFVIGLSQISSFFSQH